MSSLRDDEHWIKEELIPSLVAKGKLGFGPDSTILRSIETERVSVADTFMLTACYRVRIKLAESSDSNAIVRLVVKITPELSKVDYETVNFAQLFHNEQFAYKHIFPKLGWSDDYPKYYGSEIGDTKSYIVLGDFDQDGFRMCQQKANLSLEHILIAVTALGKFHGVFYALKHTDRTDFDNLKDQLIESRFGNVPHVQYARRLNFGTKRAVNAVRNHPETNHLIPEEYLQRLETLFDSTFDYLKTRVLPEEPHAIVTHADYLRGNLAFRYKTDKPDDPEAVLIFDFQTLRYSSPMVDLATFIGISTGVDVRSKNFGLIFDTYHNSLISNFCAAATSDQGSVPAFLNHENMLREYAEYATFGLAIAASFLVLVHDPDFGKFKVFGDISEEDDAKQFSETGGDTVNRELRALVKEMYELQKSFGVELK